MGVEEAWGGVKEGPLLQHARLEAAAAAGAATAATAASACPIDAHTAPGYTPCPVTRIRTAQRTARPQGDADGVGDLVDAGLQAAAAVGVKDNLLGLGAHGLGVRLGGAERGGCIVGEGRWWAGRCMRGSIHSVLWADGTRVVGGTVTASA